MQVENDCELTIATAKSRFDKVWHNQKIKWSAFLDVLQNSHETHETAEEYANMTKEQRGQVKDVGGFVGGYLEGGKRQKGQVKYRTLITLDVDEAPKNFQNMIHAKLDRKFSYCVYSTHSWTPDKPRYRIIIPLSKPVRPDGYICISRWVAQDVGMKYIDPTTCAPERLMFLPSHPKGNTPIFWFNSHAPILDPEKFLNSLENWKDSSTWPMWDSEMQVPTAYQAGKKADPLTRPGWVGAFNRSYTIPEVMEKFLSGIYGQFKNRTDRYTYLGGSSAGGVHCLNDYLVYSFHATDPISQQCVNAFDLCRKALFGELDLTAKPSAKGRGLPSYTAMVKDICMNDEKVKLEMQRGPDTVQKSDFDDSLIYESAAASPDTGTKPAKTTKLEAWRGQLQMTQQGKILPLAENIMLILQNDADLKDSIALDKFSHKTVKRHKMPWEKDDVDGWRIWTDTDDACLRNYISKHYGGLQARQIIDDCIKNIAEDNQFHPVIKWLEGLPAWDRKERVERLFIDYLGARDTPYNRMAARLLLRMAIARVKSPGIKCDMVIVLVGAQGIGKSTLLAQLGGKWFSDNLTTVQGKEAVEQLQGNWIIEMSEMQAQKRADNEALKSFISRQIDKVRMAYARNVSYYPRQCVLVGSTNDDSFLKDYTGNRRFVPVDVAASRDFIPAKDVHSIPKDELEQVWAEAIEDYKQNFKGPSSLLFPESMRKEVISQQELHMESRDNFDLVESFLKIGIPLNWKRMEIDERFEWIQAAMNSELDMTPGDKKEDPMTSEEIALHQREYISVKEIAVECMGMRIDNIPSFEKKKIRSIMNGMPGWIWNGNQLIKISKYGPARVFRRVDSTVDDNSLFDEKSSTISTT